MNICQKLSRTQFKVILFEKIQLNNFLLLIKGRLVILKIDLICLKIYQKVLIMINNYFLYHNFYDLINFCNIKVKLKKLVIKYDVQFEILRKKIKDIKY